MVPVSVKQEVGRQGNLLRESKGIGGQFVKRKSSGVLDDDSGAFDVGILGLHLVADQFTLADLGAPRCVLVLNVNHRGIKVLKVSKGKHRGVFNQLKGKRHLCWWQGNSSWEFEALVLHVGALCTKPADVDGVKFVAARRRNLF